MAYADKLRDSRWQEKRLRVLDRDGFKCRNCPKDNREVQVHHFDYFSFIDPWEYPMDMLVTLCISCHEKEKLRWKAEFYLLNSLRMKGFLVEDLTRLSCNVDKNQDFVKHILSLLKKI